MARFKLIDPDWQKEHTRKMQEWLDKAKQNKTPLPEPTPIIFPEDTTREDVYPSDMKYQGD